MEYYELFSQFTAMIRLPDTMKKSEKIERMNEVIDELDLRHCVDTGETQMTVIVHTGNGHISYLVITHS